MANRIRTLALACLIVGSLSGCFGPTFEDGAIACTNGQCPNGLVCSLGFCVEEPGASFCGNGAIDEGEVCDDGNQSDGDSCSSTCLAASCLVPVTHPTIAAALAATECTTVYLVGGQTFEEPVVIDGDRALRGVGSEPAVLSGQDQRTVVNVVSGNVEIESVKITLGRADRGGGLVNDGDLRLKDVEVVDNIAAGPGGVGGGIWHRSGTLTIEDSLISGNFALDTAAVPNPLLDRALGGGIAAFAVLTITGTSITDNEVAASRDEGVALARGGGISITDAALVLGADTVVDGNRAVATSPSSVAVADGGGVHAENGPFTCSGCRIANNTVRATGDTAPMKGAGIIVFAGQVALTDATIDFNRCEPTPTTSFLCLGGGLAVEGSTVDIASSSFTNNGCEKSALSVTTFSGGAGGGIYIANSTDVNIRRAIVTGNKLVFDAGVGEIIAAGAGVTIRTTVGASAITVSDSTIADNQATAPTAQGAGFEWQAESSSTLAIDRTTVSGNSVSSIGGTSGLGAGVLLLSSASPTVVTLSNSTLSGNTSVGGGEGAGLAALAFGAGSLDAELASVTITDNEVSGDNSQAGGLMWRALTSGVTSFVLRNTIVSNNAAPQLSDADCLTIGSDIEAVNSLLGSVTGCTLSANSTGNLTNSNASLEPLGDNGGATETHAPSAASLAVDAGDPTGCVARQSALTTDQRGLNRSVGAGCDIGAVERQ